MAEHTKTPWRLGRNGGDDAVFSGNRVVAMCDTDINDERGDKANAAFIVRACNSFDDLVEALVLAREFVEAEVETRGEEDEVYCVEAIPLLAKIAATLAKARGETP